MIVRNTGLDINCDMGELVEIDDGAFIPFVTSCNISCGGHTSDLEKISQTVSLAVEYNKKIGAHPSYPDIGNFGRVSMKMTKSEFENAIWKQLDFLNQLVKSQGAKLNHVKAHGALYNDLIVDPKLLKIFILVVKKFNSNLSIYGMAGSQMEQVVLDEGMAFVPEVFMDRNYFNGHQMIGRSQSDAMISSEEALKNHLSNLLNGVIVDKFNIKHEVAWKTICIHSDSKNALELLKLAVAYLKDGGHEIH